MADYPTHAEATTKVTAGVAAHIAAADPHGDRAFAVQRANHTGTQAASSITGLATVATSGAYTDLSAKPTIPTVGAAGAGAAVALSSTDASITNARTPSSHAASHATGAADPITPAAIGADAAGAATTAVSTHVAATDPHGDRAYADGKFTDGRAWHSGGFYSPWSTQIATDQPGAGELKFVPVFVPNTVTLAEIAVRILTAGSTGATTRIVVASSVNGIPGTILYCSAALDATAATKVLVTTPGITLTRGRYFFGAVTQGAPTTTPVYRSVSGGVPEQYEVADDPGGYNKVALSWFGQTGALTVSSSVPAGLALTAGDAPRVQVKVA